MLGGSELRWATLGWTALSGAGRRWPELGLAETFPTVLCSGLGWAGLRVGVALGWARVGWAGLGWASLLAFGLRWAGLGWGCLAELGWLCLLRSIHNKGASPEWAELGWAALGWASLGWAGLRCAWLGWARVGLATFALLLCAGLG